MGKQYQQYLQALVHWADEVEQKVSYSQSLKNNREWSRNMQRWKAEIKELISANLDITEEQIHQIKEKGESLVKDLDNKESFERSIAVGQHKLPPLPYEYDALEPYISKEIMKLHHDVHHKSYVDGLNKAEKMIAKWSESQNGSMLRHWMREQSFNGSGHFLHSIFWENMTPNGGGIPKGRLLKQIQKDFTSFERFKTLFTHAAQSVQGSGWTMLVWELNSGRLAIQTIEKHNMYAFLDVIPLLVLDLWEHAYYLQYETDRNKYIENWWNIVNWENVNNRFGQVKSINW